jgi:tetratricopeptide (TPR) repeat protein
LIANIEIIGKSDEEISRLAQSNSGALNVEELLYAATLTNNATDKEAIYTKASQQFANDYRGWNNMGMQRFYAGDLVKAEELFNTANSKRTNNESNINLGLIALTKGDRARAEQLIGSASGVPELGEALGVLYLLQGDYAKAVSSFGASKTNNAALAQILSKDYSKASQTLNTVTRPDATTDYLKAVVAARTNDTNAVIENLRAAIAKKPALKREAALDLEFAKYATNSSFTSLVN